MPRSNAARAASRCATGAFGASRMRGGSANFYALRRALHTPHASLMQDVPSLPLSCPSGEFRGQTGPQGCWTERTAQSYTRFMVSLPLPDLSCHPPLYDRCTFGRAAITDRYTRAMRAEPSRCRPYRLRPVAEPCRPRSPHSSKPASKELSCTSRILHISCATIRFRIAQWPVAPQSGSSRHSHLIDSPTCRTPAIRASG